MSGGQGLHGEVLVSVLEVENVAIAEVNSDSTPMPPISPRSRKSQRSLMGLDQRAPKIKVSRGNLVSDQSEIEI